MGAVDELVDQHEGAWRQLLLERAAGRERDEVGDPCPLHHVDIGAVVDVGGREPVSLVVARHEHDRQARRSRRYAEAADGSPHGLVDALLAHILESRKIVEPRAADNAEHCLCHVTLSLPLVTRRPACRTPPDPTAVVPSSPGFTPSARVLISQSGPCWPIPSGTPSASSARIQSDAVDVLRRETAGVAVDRDEADLHLRRLDMAKHLAEQRTLEGGRGLELRRSSPSPCPARARAASARSKAKAFLKSAFCKAS